MIPDPARVSAGEVIAFLKRATRASVKQGEPLGGTKQIIDTLRTVIEENSGEIHASEPVTEIIVQEGKATGVRTAAAEYAANAVVFAAPVNHVLELIDEKVLNADFAAYAKNIQPSSGLSIDFVSDEPLAAIRGSILGLDVPLWVRFQTSSDPTIAPPGKHVSTWAMLFEPGTAITEEVIDTTEKRIKGIVNEVLPLALNRVIRERKLVAPVINGNMLIPGQSYPHRPPIMSRQVQNLYLVGDTTQAEGCSGDIAFASAIRLVQFLLPLPPS
jgi:phytoene dehydrogenase-like protein